MELKWRFMMASTTSLMALCCNTKNGISLCPADIPTMAKILIFEFCRIVQDHGMVKRHSWVPVTVIEIKKARIDI